MKELGFQIGDLNNKKLEDDVFSLNIPVALDNGARRGTFKGFVTPVKEKVDVMTYSVVSNLITDAEGQNAVGVKVERFGQKLQYFASNEVILSAGAIGSPQGNIFNELYLRFNFTNTAQLYETLDFIKYLLALLMNVNSLRLHLNI